LTRETDKGTEEKATEFWQGLAEDHGLKAGDPTEGTPSALARHYNDKSVTPQLFLVARAWNAFFAGKPVKAPVRADRQEVPDRRTSERGRVFDRSE
jgi:hypothetical protein